MIGELGLTSGRTCEGQDFKLPKIMLIDGNNLLVRAAHAGKHAHLSSGGVETGTLLIFINLLSRHIREEKPDSVVVCWDGGKSAYRLGLYPEYKAGRAERPEEDEPDRPFAQAKEFLTLAGIHHVERQGWEADDLIACYWRTIRPIETRIVIVSGDKDLLQLVDQNCVQVRPTSQREVRDCWDVSRVQQEYDCDPFNLSKAMALIGDTSDNIPGVKGIGPKKAAKTMRSCRWSVQDAASVLQDEKVILWHQLIDLRDIPFTTLGLTLPQPPNFDPTMPGSVAFNGLSGFLDRYQLGSVRDRLLAHSLWTEQEGI